MNYKRVFIPNSCIFITVVTYKRKNILTDNIEYLRQAFCEAKTKYNFDIIAIVINPNHFHMIIRPENISEYPKIIGIIKKTFTQISGLKTEQNKNREADVWQRRYWEHSIIDENDLNKHIDYIHYNPVKHGYVKSPKEWKYSSFMKFVQAGFYEENWCNFGDINLINNLNYE